MPEIGEVKRAREIGRTGSYKVMWTECPVCKTCRWVTVSHKGLCCRPCSTRTPEGRMTRAKGGHNRVFARPPHEDNGYIRVYVDDNDFFRPMAMAKGAHGGWIKEHRLVMARHLGRCLQKWEIVHHKNGDKSDNRIENLELAMPGGHAIAHGKGYKDGYRKGLYDAHEKRIRELEARVTMLEAENALLKTRLTPDGRTA